MKVKLIERVVGILKLSPYSPNYNNLSNKDKYKFAKLLIENKYIEVDNKIITYPYEMVNIKSYIKRINHKLEYDRSLLSIYNYLQIKKKYNNNISIRKKSTYKYKLELKKNPLIRNNTLDLIIFQSGFFNSIKESQHYIKQGYIKINNKIINNINYYPKYGDLITNNHPNALFNYFKQKYLALLPRKKFKKNNRSYYRLPVATQPKYIIKINFNQVLYLPKKIL